KPVERPLDLLRQGRYRNVLARRELFDVVAAVAVLVRLLPMPTCLDRGAELLHLGAGVVVVVLALDLVACELEQAGHRVAVGAVPRRGDRDRAGRVRGDHLDLDPLAAGRLAGAKIAAPFDDRGERFGEP